MMMTSMRAAGCVYNCVWWGTISTTDADEERDGNVESIGKNWEPSSNLTGNQSQGTEQMVEIAFSILVIFFLPL